MNVAWSDIPAGLRIAIVIYAAVQIGVEVYALVDLVRTPAERIVTGKKWLWALLIVFVNLIGAIAYLVAGKKPAPAEDPARAKPDTGAPPVEDRAKRAADLLYGPGEKGDRR